MLIDYLSYTPWDAVAEQKPESRLLASRQRRMAHDHAFFKSRISVPVLENTPARRTVPRGLRTLRFHTMLRL